MVSPIPEPISSFLLTMFQSMLSDAMKDVIHNLKDNHPIRKAINRVSAEYPSIENLSNTLTEFIEKDTVKHSVDQLVLGKRDIPLEELVDTMCTKTHFYMGEQTQEKAREIIVAFCKIFFEELIKSEEYGRLVQANRFEEIAKSELQEHMKTRENFQEVFSELKGVMNDCCNSILNTSIDIEVSKRLSDVFKKRIDEAKIFLESGKVKTAENLYITIIKDFEEQRIADNNLLFRAYNNLASCEWLCGEDSLAGAHFIKANSFLPEDIKSIANAALGYLLLQKVIDAFNTINQALAIDSHNLYALCIKANILLNMEKFDEALSLFEGISLDGECYYMLGNIYLKKGDYDKAIDCLKQSLSMNDKNIDTISLLAQSLFHKVDAKIKVNFILPSEMDVSDVKFLCESKSLYSKAIELLKDQERVIAMKNVLVNCSAVSIFLGSYDDALECCKNALNYDQSYQLAWNNKAISEFLAGKYSDAIDSFTKLLKIQGESNEILAKISQAYILDGKPEVAIDLLEEKDEIDLRLVLAKAYRRNQNYKKARESIESLLIKYPTNPEVLVALANLELFEGEIDKCYLYYKKAIEYAANLLKKLIRIQLADVYYDNLDYINASEIYKDYVDFRIDSPLLYKYLICLYYLEDYDKCLKIINAYTSNNEPDEFYLKLKAAIYEVLGQLKEAYDIYFLLSKRFPQKLKYQIRQGLCLFRQGKDRESVDFLEKIKDLVKGNADQMMALAEAFDFVGKGRVAIDLGYRALCLQAYTPRINLAFIKIFLKSSKDIPPEEMDDKYIKAFQDTIANFNKRFPNEKSLKTIKVSDNLKEIFEMVDSLAKKTDFITKQFKERNFPLYTLSTLLQRDLFAVWGAVVSMPELVIWVATGLSSEQQEETHLALESQDIVIDSFALFTFRYLELLPELSNSFSKIYVSQSTQDHLLAIIRENQIGLSDGYMTIGKQGEQYIREEIPSATVQKKIDFLNDIKTFISDKVVGLTRDYNENEKKWEELFTAKAVDPILLAFEKNIPICCDDRALLLFFKGERHLSCFCSYYVLKKMASLGVITQDKYYEKLNALIKLSYFYIPIDNAFILYLLRRDGFKISDDLTNVFKVIESKDTLIDSAVEVVANTIRTIWLEDVLNADKLKLLDLALFALTKQRSMSLIVRKIKATLIVKFYLLPLQREEVFMQIDNWVRAHKIII